ncbi:hypothetical protein [Chitinolyticbacter meiyuanensis]|uniref:hypothetical protein n=1 Tax=Chitinolyticbacter meiyuanensis TaxID=682798 RepID=UPI0011E5E8C0|nr:hypothetical protein [Chitinolyticbacter meiyuanensis]
MEKCEHCGSESEWTFTLTIGGKTHVFDSFERAIFTVARPCGHCGSRILGHGVSTRFGLFCCDRCAEGFEAALDAQPQG